MNKIVFLMYGIALFFIARSVPAVETDSSIIDRDGCQLCHGACADDLSARDVFFSNDGKRTLPKNRKRHLEWSASFPARMTGTKCNGCHNNTIMNAHRAFQETSFDDAPAYSRRADMRSSQYGLLGSRIKKIKNQCEVPGDSELMAQARCADKDSDTYFDCNESCDATGLPCGDCDDSDPGVNPGASDDTCNGVDENCDGMADNGYVPRVTACGLDAYIATGVTSCIGGAEQDSCISGLPIAGRETECIDVSGSVSEGLTGTGLSAGPLSPFSPPVRQEIGVLDGVFNDLTEADCRFCHENPDQFPVENVTIPNRHHLLVGSLIPDFTEAPFGMPGDLYECLSCHAVDEGTGSLAFVVDRDCTVCHVQNSIFELTVHHRTELAQGTTPEDADCQACHGTIVDNMNDGHFIPTYEPTPRTPKRSGGTAPPLNSRDNGAGACNYCHDSGITPEGRLVQTNIDTHHGTGFWGGLGAHGFVCFWCHDFSLPFGEQFRVCEKCHGPDSLHSIQADSDGDGMIIPGNEIPGFGHVGNPDDCWGCHGFIFESSASIEGLSD